MDLNQPSIAIRERSTLEIFDLTLHVFRDHVVNVLILLAINALPFMIVDAVLVHGVGIGDGDVGFELAVMMILIASQSQIGTLLITQYLGTAMFSKRPTVKQTVAAFLGRSKSWLWSHGVVRMVLPMMVLIGILQGEGVGWAMLLLAVAMLIRLLRPFISEILLLEQPKIRKPKFDDGSAVTLSRRSKNLHHGEVVGGGVMAWMIGGSLLVMVASLFFHFDGATGLGGAWDGPIRYLYWPLAGWLVASFLTTFRFLHYINTRIKQEGWEIALKLMAEKQRIAAEGGD